MTSDEFQQPLQLHHSVAPELGILLQSICEDCRYAVYTMVCAPPPWQVRCSCLVAMHRDASDTTHCLEKYRRLFEAVSNYPAAAFLHPLYAHSQFANVLQHQQHIGHVEGADMHHGFPLLHDIV